MLIWGGYKRIPSDKILALENVVRAWAPRSPPPSKALPYLFISYLLGPIQACELICRLEQDARTSIRPMDEIDESEIEMHSISRPRTTGTT